MRICFLATADNPHFLRWARYLAGRGHELLCLCDRPGPEGFVDLPACEVRHPQPNLVEAVLCFKVWRHRYGWFFFRVRPFRRAVMDFEPAIVHGMEALSYGYAVSRCGGFARVLTPWGNDILVDPRKSKLARWLVTRALRNVEAVTTNLPTLRDAVVEEFDVSPERIHAFSWGVDLEVFHPGYEEEARALAERWQIPEGAIVFLSNRQTREHWGTGEIAEAVPRVLAREPRSFFVFLRGRGDPEFEVVLRRRVEESGSAHRVRWVADLLSEKEMAAALNLAHAFVSVPRTDLLSISVLEGMACGSVPVVGDLPAYRARLHEGENAVVVPQPVTAEHLAEALLIAAAHPEWRPQFAARNLVKIRDLDNWAENARKMEQVYHFALENPVHPRKRI